MTPGLIERLEGAGGHTPGPWTARRMHTGGWDVFDPRGRDVVTVYGGGVEIESREANARLIAAAPDLLDALQKLVALHDTFCARHGNQEDAYNLVATRWADFDAARAAILKARATQEQETLSRTKANSGEAA